MCILPQLQLCIGCTPALHSQRAILRNGNKPPSSNCWKSITWCTGFDAFSDRQFFEQDIKDHYLSSLIFVWFASASFPFPHFSLFQCFNCHQCSVVNGINCNRASQLSLQLYNPARVQGLLATDRVPQWDWVKIFRNKRAPALKWIKFGNKRNVLIGPTGKTLVTYRARNAPLTKNGLLKQKIEFLAKMIVLADFEKTHDLAPCS